MLACDFSAKLNSPRLLSDLIHNTKKSALTKGPFLYENIAGASWYGFFGSIIWHREKSSARAQVWPGLVAFKVVVAVTFGDSEPGWSEGLWETVSLDVWLVVVVWKDWLGCVSSVRLGVCEGVEGGGDDDDDTLSKASREVTSCVCRVFLLVVMVDNVTSVFFSTVEGVGCAAFVVISCSAADVELVPEMDKRHKNGLEYNVEYFLKTVLLECLYSHWLFCYN